VLPIILPERPGRHGERRRKVHLTEPPPTRRRRPQSCTCKRHTHDARARGVCAPPPPTREVARACHFCASRATSPTLHRAHTRARNQSSPLTGPLFLALEFKSCTSSMQSRWPARAPPEVEVEVARLKRTRGSQWLGPAARSAQAFQVAQTPRHRPRSAANSSGDTWAT
jgi:hypothetical protein